jgi:hypothetical protein
VHPGSNKRSNIGHPLFPCRIAQFAGTPIVPLVVDRKLNYALKAFPPTFPLLPLRRSTRTVFHGSRPKGIATPHSDDQSVSLRRSATVVVFKGMLESGPTSELEPGLLRRSNSESFRRRTTALLAGVARAQTDPTHPLSCQGTWIVMWCASNRRGPDASDFIRLSGSVNHRVLIVLRAAGR